MKKHNYKVLLVLASAFLLVGCKDRETALRGRKNILVADANDSFTVTTNLEEIKEIHTTRQAEYLDYYGDYATIPEEFYPDGQQHLSDPEAVNLAWSFTPAVGKTLSRFDVVVGKEADLSDGYIIKGTTAQSLDIYNSYLGNNYFQVIANYTDGSKDETPIQKYEVDEVYPRNLKIDGMTNCRDMGGGRILEDGGTIKQGLIFRTSSTSSWAYGRGAVPDTITADGKETLLNRLGCKTEINVNNSGSAMNGIPNYVQAYMYYDGGKHHLYRNAEPIKEVFHALSDINNYPVFYHCRIGTDRTGLCAILISGLLGVSENDIYQDYLFSNFGNIQEKRYIGEKAGRDNILRYIDDLKAFPGEKFHNKVYNYLLAIGVPAEELNNVISILTEGNQAEGNDNHQEIVLAKDFVPEDLEMKTETSQKHPKQYYTLEKDCAVSATFHPDYRGEAKLVAYLGSTNDSSTLYMSDAFEVEIDGEFFEMDEVTFADAGFGQGDGRTYYSAVVLGIIDVQPQDMEIRFEGNSNNLNIGAISIIPTEVVSQEGEAKPSKKGCGGSITLTTSLIALIAVSGVSLLLLKRKREN